MNINDVNNPLISGDLSKGKRISEKRETDRTDKTTGRIRTQQESDVQTSQVRDTFESTENRKLAADVKKMIDGNEPAPREEAVSRDRAEIEQVNKGGPIAMADFTITNDSSVAALREQTAAVIKELESGKTLPPGH